MTLYTNIRAALESNIAGITGIPSSSNRAWESVFFERTTGTAYVRMTLQPTGNEPAVMGPSPQQHYRGLFRIDVYAPINEGPLEADALADNIRAAFNVDTDLTSGGVSVRIRKSERLSSGMESPWYIVPVQVSWYTYQP